MMRMVYIRRTQHITGLIVTLGPLVHQAILRYEVTAPTSVVIHIHKVTETPEKQYRESNNYIVLVNNHILFTTCSAR